MIFTKKMNIKLFIMLVSFMVVIILTNHILMHYGLNKNIQYTYDYQYKKIQDKIRQNVEISEKIVNKLSENEKVVNILEINRRYMELDSTEKDQIDLELQKFKIYLRDILMMNSIDILNDDEEYLISNIDIVNTTKLIDQPWFNSKYVEEHNDSITTDVYKDFKTDKYKISFVKFVYSDIDKELLGAAIFTLSVDDLINSLNPTFYMGNLNTYIKINGNTYYDKDGIVENFNEKSTNNIMKLNNINMDNIEIYIEFDKESIIYNREIKNINRTKTILFTITGIIYSFILVFFIKKTLKPLIKSLDKLKGILKNLENDNSNFDMQDEFQQLEFIANSIGKSVDKKIKSLIYYDELTKLPNRKLIYKFCNKLISIESEFALIFIDLNKFKYINDVFGHGAGDELLVEFSTRMESILEDRGLITRYSGDEFIIIYNKYTSNEELEEFYYNILLEEFSKPVILKAGQKITIDFSAGVAVYPKDGKSLDELIDKSDFMMYSSKRSMEGNKLLFFNDEIYNKLINVENIKHELNSAIENNELVIHYQPIVDKNKNTRKIEALIRWNSGKLGFISPRDFVGYAEENRKIIDIGYWIIEEVCKNISDIFESVISSNSIKESDMQHKQDELQVSINVSTIQLLELDFVEQIKNIIEKYNISMRNLCFEITESVVIEENNIVYDNIKLLHKLGASIALDDFGTGYASFSYLKKLNIDILKIDKCFIESDSELDYKIVENIKNIAHLLHIDTIVEGVECENQFKALCEIECDYYQGYHFAKPMDLSELKLWLNK